MRRKVYEPKVWDVRYIKKFLWWPTTIKGEERWLERAYIMQQYRATRWWPVWVDLCWATKEEYEKGE